MRILRSQLSANSNIAMASIDVIVIFMVQGLLILSLLIAILLAADKAQASNMENNCGGKNLLEQLSPDNLNAAMKEADATPNARGLLWTIEKDGVEPSWLFGTMHVSDPRILSLPRSAANAVEQSDIVVIETLGLLDPAKAQAAILSNPDLTTFTNGKNLTSDMNADDKEFVKNELEKRGVPISLVSHLKPWMIMGLVAASQCENERKANGIQVLDLQLAERAQKAGKELGGLETMVEQISAMATLPIDFQIRGLIETLKIGDMVEDLNETMIALYLSEETALITPALKAVSLEMGGEDMNDPDFGAFEAEIILKRNHLMAERAEPILQKGNAFIAVGALHLPGKEGIIELLRRRGYTLNRAQ